MENISISRNNRQLCTDGCDNSKGEKQGILKIPLWALDDGASPITIYVGVVDLTSHPNTIQNTL